MTRLALLLVALAALLALFVTGPARAETPKDPHAAPGSAAGHAPAAEGHGAAHGEDHGPGEINWFYGLAYEKEGAEPSLLVRPKGMQPPLGALLLNTGILFYLLWRFGRRPVSDALKKRRTAIMHGIEDAARMRDDAEERLAEYEDKLEHLDDEIERFKREMREASEAERTRVLAEAKERRVRMERDAHLLIEQELKTAHQELVREAVASALHKATERLARGLTAADQQRMADEYLAAIDSVVINARGGRA